MRLEKMKKKNVQNSLYTPLKPATELILTGDVMAVAVFAVALLQTSLAIRLGWTSVLAYRSDVTGSAFELSGHVIAR